MKNFIFMTALASSVAALAIGCGASSSEEQQRALQHQQNSDNAASRGQYNRAAEEQQKAQDSHHDAVDKAIQEGNSIPPQPQPGDRPAPPKP